MFEQEDQKKRNEEFGFNMEDFEEEDELLLEDDDLNEESENSYFDTDNENYFGYSEDENDNEEFAWEDEDLESEGKAEDEDANEGGGYKEGYNEEEERDADSKDKSEEEVDGREIGIDLGTTNSVVSFIDKNGATGFVKVKNEILIPSCIFFKARDDVYYGKKAKAYAKSMIEGTAVSLFKKYLRADSEKIKVRIPKTESCGADGKKYYVIDTNVFIDQPDIVERLKENEIAVLALTVEQELEYRMTDVNTKYSAEKALQEIEKYRDRIQFEESDVTLLPEDFFKSFSENYNNANNDNKILTIAMKYKEKNATLISSDNRLVKLKADFVGVKGLTLKEFHLQRMNDTGYEEFELTGTEATTMFLVYLKKEAEKTLKQSVNKAVITVPATFNIVEIENTKKAGLDAGFKEIHIEKEPTAAAIAYNVDAGKEATTFIYDFGGGTFDVSIIQSDGDGNFEVCATAGNSKLGGEDLTSKLEEYVYDYLEEQYDLSMYSEEDSELTTEHYIYNRNKIYWAADTCKIELSASENTTMTLMDIYISDTKQKSVFIDMTRVQLEESIKSTINHTITEMNNGLSKANMMKEDVDNIILAGGSSLIPCIRDQVEKYFGRKPSADKNAATLIAEGAAIIADSLYGENHLIKMQPQVFDMTYEDFGVALEKWNYSCIIPAGTTLPATAEKKYSLVEDYQSQLNIKVLSRKSEAQDAVKTYDQGVEYLDELIMTNIPPMKMDEVDVIVKFEITKQYELRTDVTLIKKDRTIVDKGNMSIDRQSTM